MPFLLMGETARKIGGIDGRLVRSERARAAVIDALLSLIEEGDLQPTVPRIAERARVSLRTVFHHFQDMEKLFAAVADRHLSRVFAVLRPISEDGPRANRQAAFLEQRARIFEMTAAVRRAALLAEPFSPEIAARLRWARHAERSEVVKVFAPELSRRARADRADLEEALALTSSFAAWEQLRSHQNLTPERAHRVLGHALDALFHFSAASPGPERRARAKLTSTPKKLRPKRKQAAELSRN